MTSMLSRSMLSVAFVFERHLVVYSINRYLMIKFFLLVTSYLTSHHHLSSISLLFQYFLFYFQRDLATYAIPILEKCLLIFPSYVPALADRAVAYYKMKDIPNTEMSLLQLEVHSPEHESIKRIRDALQLDRLE